MMSPTMEETIKKMIAPSPSLRSIMKKATLKITKNDMLELVVSKPLNESESDFVRARIPGLKRLVKHDYSCCPDGWQIDPALPERAFLVSSGGLLDSCVFNSASEAQAFLSQIQAHGRAACR